MMKGNVVMSSPNNQITTTTDAARAGREEGVFHYVLAASLSLAITTMSFVWISAAVAMP